MQGQNTGETRLTKKQGHQFTGRSLTWLVRSPFQ